MTSRERFEAWFNEHLKTATGNGWSVADLETAWKAAEHQALERAAQKCEDEMRRYDQDFELERAMAAEVLRNEIRAMMEKN